MNPDEDPRQDSPAAALPAAAHGELLAGELTPQLQKAVKRLLGKVTARTWRSRADALLQPLSGFVKGPGAHPALDMVIAALSDAAAGKLQDIYLYEGEFEDAQAAADERRAIAAHSARALIDGLTSGSANISAGIWPGVDELPWQLDSPGPVMHAQLDSLRSWSSYDRESHQRLLADAGAALTVLASFRTVKPVPGCVELLREALIDGVCRDEMLVARGLLTTMPDVYAFTDRIGRDEQRVLHLSCGADEDGENVALCGAQLTTDFADRGTWLEHDEDELPDGRCPVCATRAGEVPEASEDALAPLGAPARARIHELVSAAVQDAAAQDAPAQNFVRHGLPFTPARDEFLSELVRCALTDYCQRAGQASLQAQLDRLVRAQLPKKYVAHWDQLGAAVEVDPELLVSDITSGQMCLLFERELARYAYLSACHAAKVQPAGPLKLDAPNRVWRFPAPR